MTVEFYRQLTAALQIEAVVVATVIRVRGSVPREVGAKMGIAASGLIVGTIGGGAGEATVIKRAMEVLTTGISQSVSIDLTGAPGRHTQGICGGSMQVWLQRWAGEGAIALTETLLHQLQVGKPVQLVTVLAANHDPYLKPECFNDFEHPLLHGDRFIEPIRPAPTLLIVGAGHVGVALARVAQTIGFQVAVQDDRSDYACVTRFPSGCRVFDSAIAITLQKLHYPIDLYVAMVTRSYVCDLNVLHQLLTLKSIAPRYIGMIGSQKRVATVFQSLQQQGIASDRLQTIYAPIGLKIGALTPEEIAISICAELIQVRRMGATIDDPSMASHVL